MDTSRSLFSLLLGFPFVGNWSADFSNQHQSHTCHYWPALIASKSALLGGQKLGPLFRHDRHLKVVSASITGLEPASGNAANTINMKLLVDLAGDLIHQILKVGIKIARVLVSISLKGQLGLGKNWVCNNVQEMTNTGNGAVGCKICFLFQDPRPT